MDVYAVCGVPDRLEGLRSRLPVTTMFLSGPISDRDVEPVPFRHARGGHQRGPGTSNPIRAGEVDCTLRHEACWEKIANGQNRWAVVVEDDVKLDPDWMNRTMDAVARLPESWAVLYLGRLWYGRTERSYGPGIHVAGLSIGTHAYALSVSGAKELLGADCRAHMMPVNEFLMGVFLPQQRRLFSLCPQVALQSYPRESRTWDSPVWAPSA